MKRNVCILVIFYFAGTTIIQAQTKNIDSLQYLLQNEKQDTVRCSILEQLGLAYQGSNPDRALMFAQQGLELSGKIKYLRGEVNCLTRIGCIYSITGNGTKGLELVLQSLKASEKLNDASIRSYILRLAGDVYSDLSDYRKSLEYDFKSLAIATEMHYDLQRTVCLGDIGDNYEKLNILDSAKIFTEAEYELARKRNNADLMGVGLNNLGNIYTKKHELALAMEKAKENHIRNLQLLAIGIFIPVFFLIVLLLSRTKVTPRVVEFLGILSLLLLFEFITDLIYPYVSVMTNENPIWEMFILVIVAALLEPLNFKMEHWVKSHLVHKQVIVPLTMNVENFQDDTETE